MDWLFRLKSTIQGVDMGCLFGYCGEPAEGLLDSMAGLLAHRCKQGWERTAVRLDDGRLLEMGRGIPPWLRTGAPHVGASSQYTAAIGYSGALFDWIRGNSTDNPRGPAPEQLMDILREDPKGSLARCAGAFVMAFGCGGEFYLTRDASGIKAVYWTANRDRLVFASEIKALFADPSVPRVMRPAALAEYLTFSFVPGSRTMFEGIEELQPGCMLESSSGQVNVRRYFALEDYEFDGDGRVEPERSIADIRSRLEASVRECCHLDDRPPAVFLSGGIDSSAVLALAARERSDAPIKTFSVHFGDRYTNENHFVSMMVERYGTEHTWLEIRPSGFLKQMRSIIWRLDDPIGDPITVPNYLMSEAASKATSIVLNGEGGDPCFGGPKNIPMILSLIYGAHGGSADDRWLERDYLLSYRKCFNDIRQILTPDVWKQSGGEEALTEIVAPFFRAPVPRSFLNKLMAINIRLKGANLILVKVDKMSSANGLLALAPLFSRRIIEGSMRCPPWLKLEGNVEKAVLKKAVQDVVPAPIIERPKSGMMVPVRFWFQGEMRRYAKKTLSRKNLLKTGLFDPKYVKSLLNYEVADLHGLRYGMKLWMLVTFMLWRDQMLETPRSRFVANPEGSEESGWRRAVGWRRSGDSAPDHGRTL